MAATWPNFLCGFIVLCLINGAFSIITVEPENTLVERCEDKYANMTCVSDAMNEISWTYDGNTVINAPCSANTDVFLAKPTGTSQCDIAASLALADDDPFIKSISGPYGCTDRSNDGKTSTSMVVVLDAWCGIVNGCPVMEGQDVTIGCYGQYDWLSDLLQYNPIVSLVSTIQFVDETGTFRQIKPDREDPPGPPYPLNLTTKHTFTNVQAGQPLNATCRIDFAFSRDTAYSGRNNYANNSLHWSCSTSHPVNYCPRNVSITPRDACLAGENLTCTADSYPPAEIFWIEHHNNGAIVMGPTYTLKTGKYDVTCVASINVSCSISNEVPVCKDFDSYAMRESDPVHPDFPYNLFGFTAVSSASPITCNANDTVDGYATKCPTMTLEALNGTKCLNNTVYIREPSTVAFNCTYEIDEDSNTTYSWDIDGSELTQTTSVAHIFISSGSHYVTCTGVIKHPKYPNAKECECNDTRRFDVIVVECYDSMVSPDAECVTEGTQFTCNATGYPGAVKYTWTHRQLPPTNSQQTGTGVTYRVDAVGQHTLGCTAAFSAPSFCPEYMAECHSNVTFRVFGSYIHTYVISNLHN